MNKYDIIILGAGPGGYVAGLYAAGLGKKVLVVEKNSIGGVCLNCGCIPTKTLMASAKAMRLIKRSNEFGIDIPSYKLNYKNVKLRKDQVVNSLKKGIEMLFKAKKIDFKIGSGLLIDKNVVSIGNEAFEAKDIIIATGTSPAEIPGFKFDGNKILSSKHMLELEKLPKNLLIIGGGVNGCEYAYIYACFGVKVTIVEMFDRLLPTMDRELGKNMEMILKKLGVKVMTKTKLDKIPKEYDKAAICVGRKFNSDGIGLEKLGIKTDKGKIITDEFLKTNVPGIYSIGDVRGGYLLAHVASHEGITACENIMGKAKAMDYTSVPLCIYTEPEIASVGLTQDEAKKQGLDVKITKFLFKNLGKSHAIGELEGFVKIIGNKASGEILGVQMVGAQVTDLIQEAVLAVKTKMKTHELCDTIHAHPTLSEALMEAAFLSSGKPLHSI